MIRSLHVRDFLGVRDSSPFILGQFNVLYGVNGAGKTSLADAILFALTGKAVRFRTLGEHVRQGAKKATVEVELEGGNITREITSKGQKSYVDGVETKATDTALGKLLPAAPKVVEAALRAGALLELAPVELQQLLVDLARAEITKTTIEDELGVDALSAMARLKIPVPSDLKGFPAVYDRAVIIRREAKPALKFAEEAATRVAYPRHDLVAAAQGATLAQIEKQIEGLLARREIAVRAESSAAGASAERVRQVRDRIAELERVPSAEAVDLAGAEKRLLAAQREVTRLEVDLAGTTQRRDELAAQSAGDDAVVDVAAVERRVVETERALDAARREVSRLEGERTALTSRRTELAGKADGSNELPADADTLEARIAEKDKELRAANAARDLALARGKEARATLDVYEKAGADACCPSCRQALTPTAKAAIEKERETLVGQYRELGAVAEALSDELAALVVAASQRDAVLARRKAAAELGEIDGRLAEIGTRLKIERDTEKTQTTALATAREEKRRAEVLAQRQAARAELARLNGTLTALARDLVDATDAVTAAEAEVARLRPLAAAHTAFAAAAKELAALRPELARAAVPAPALEDVAALEADIARAEAIAAELKVDAARKKADAEVLEAKSELEEAEKLCEALGPKGAPARLLAKAIGPFLDEANRVVGQMAPGYAVEVRADDALELVVRHNGAVLRPAELSDGERTRVLYGFQIAVARLAGVPLLVLDRAELVDDEARKLVKRVAAAEAGDGIQVVMLTCAKPPAAAVPGMTAVVMHEGVGAVLGAKAVA